MNRIKLILPRLVGVRAAWPLLASVVLLCAMGLLALRASSPERAQAQQIFAAVGFGVMLLVVLPNYLELGRLAYFFMACVVLLLGFVMFLPAIKGSHRWIPLPIGVSSVSGAIELQPSELAKISFVAALAWYLRYRKDLQTLRGLIWPFAIMLAHMALILIEPDLGTALLFPVVLYIMLISAGAKVRHLMSILFVALLAGALLYPLAPQYQKDRVNTAIAHFPILRQVPLLRNMIPSAPVNNQAQGYQQHQSEIAIGSGGSFGQGIDGADQIRHGILPEAYNDFVFAVIGTQWGLAGTLIVLALYIVLFASGLEISTSCGEPFGRLLVLGVVSMIIIQAMINVAMTIGLCPVVGIALPMLSYGGSSLVTNLAAIGLLLNVSVRQAAGVVRPEFGFSPVS